MTLGKHNWICSICGQGLTRKSTAKRHNNNLHSGAGLLVRPYDYIIGRLNGTFSQSDPSLFRRKKNVSDSIYQQQHTKSNHIKATVYTQSGAAPSHIQTSHKSVDNVQAPPDMEKMTDIMLKLPEFKILLNKHYSPDVASQIIASAAYLASQGNSKVFLDKYLEALRNIDRAKS
ncbi:MAG: hypothetical protein JO297_06520 [Nitrososphaeraceae archaeon]|nr:hypothetical protein [Nitrososphaeraceae archaeon]